MTDAERKMHEECYNATRFPIAVASNSRGMIRKSATSDQCAAVPAEERGYCPCSYGTMDHVRRMIAEGHILPAYPPDNHSPEMYE